jgi:hypothetical protein
VRARCALSNLATLGFYSPLLSVCVQPATDSGKLGLKHIEGPWWEYTPSQLGGTPVVINDFSTLALFTLASLSAFQRFVFITRLNCKLPHVAFHPYANNETLASKR